MSTSSAFDALRNDLAKQREFVLDRTPVYARLLELVLGPSWELLAPRLLEAWAGRTFDAWYERPLLLLASLRDDALREGPPHPLFDAIGRPDPRLEAATEAALGLATAPERGHFWRNLATRFVQTNETSRAVTWLWVAALVESVDPGRPLALFDLGASAGLNLVADALPSMWEAADHPLDVAPLPAIASRAAFDLRPLHVSDDEAVRWLRACVWAGQTDREARLAAAIDAFRRLSATPAPPRLIAASAAEIPPRLPRPTAGDPRALAYQTIVRDYLAPDERARYEAGMAEWLLASRPGSAIWAELELVRRPAETTAPAGLTVHFRGGPEGHTHELLLARCEPHPRVLEVDAAAVASFCEQIQTARP